jgi:hypothetical protein
MPLKPLLQAMVLADHVYRDGASGKCIIAGTFSTVVIAERNVSEVAPEDRGVPSEIEGERKRISGVVSMAGSPYLYVALTEVRGTVPLRIRYVNLGDSTVLLEGSFKITSGDPTSTAEYIFELPPLPIAPGHFSLDLLFEGEILGSWRVVIKRLATVEGEEQVS